MNYAMVGGDVHANASDLFGSGMYLMTVEVAGHTFTQRQTVRDRKGETVYVAYSSPASKILRVFEDRGEGRTSIDTSTQPLAGKVTDEADTGLPLTAGQKAAATRRRNLAALADQIGGAS